MRSGRMARVLSSALALATAASLFSAAPAAQAFYLGVFTSTPAITWTGSSLVLAATDSDTNNLDYWWQAAGSTTWTEEAVAAGIIGTPAIAWTGSAVVLTAVGANGYLYYWWQAAGTTTWHQQTVSTLDFTGNGYPTRPSIAWTGSSVIITASDADEQSYNEIPYYWWEAAGASTWNQETVGDQFSAPPQIAWAGNTAEIVSGTEDGAGFNYYWEPEGSPTWQADYNYDTYSMTPLYPAIAPAGQTAIMAFANMTGSDSSGNEINYLCYGWQPTTTSWTVEQIDSSTRLGEYSDGTPALIMGSAGPIIAATGYDGNLYAWLRNPRSGQFVKQTVATITSPASYSAPAITFNGSAAVIAGVTSTGYLYAWTQDAGTWTQQLVS
jgi:hypothetical protein